MFKRLILALIPPALLVALPLFLRPSAESGKIFTGESVRTDSLVVISPHSEPIKYEFERAFRKYYREKTGHDVEIDWRSVGGTNDITRYIDDRFTANFRFEWEKNGDVFSDAVRKAFRDPKSTSSARKMFLDSNIGIGIDLFFGGGTYDHAKFASAGYAVDAGVQMRHREYFAPDIIPQTFAGETIYDPDGRFYGCCLSSFGIAANPDRFQDASLPLPERWTDLAADALFQRTALADPTKSGSINKCYEMILQQAMSELGPERGWDEGFRRIILIASNARYVTDSAGKLVRDVSSGAVAAGMCIDFYGFSEAEWTRHSTGKPRLVYRMPVNGSAVTSDPVQLLRGAPNRETAQMFIDFLLSVEGQKIWIQKAGTPGGPEKFSLLRSCVRRDLLKTVPAEYLSYPEYDPYAMSGAFQYHAEWTGRYFSLIRTLVKDIALDPLDELRAARKAILENGGEDANPEAMAALSKLPVSFRTAPEFSKKLSSGSPGEVAALRRSWLEFAVRQYREAARLAREKGARK